MPQSIFSASDIQRAHSIAAQIPDPEIPVVTIADLGILRDVTERDGVLHVAIIPTYSGCPAMTVIADDIKVALRNAGFGNIKVALLQSPAWSTDFITAKGRAKLKTYGIAPPQADNTPPACPLCASADTEKLSQFGSTACKALWRCKSCKEPFDYFKCL